jgi:hypothetical protein
MGEMAPNITVHFVTVISILFQVLFIPLRDVTAPTTVPLRILPTNSLRAISSPSTESLVSRFHHLLARLAS